MIPKHLRIICLITVVSVLFVRIFSSEKSTFQNYELAYLKKGGYDGEMHYVVTEDNYILGLQRLVKGPDDHHVLPPGAKSDDKHSSQKMGSVLFIHGLTSSGVDWIRLLQRDSLPYILFDQGFDVWLGNARGTPLSTNHTTLDSHKDARKFWNYSFQEIGYYDLPAMINYILNTTNSENIFYIGMSQGEASFLVLTSTRPEYNKKIRVALLLSASSHLKHSDNTVMKTLGNNWSLLQTLSDALGVYILPDYILKCFCKHRIFFNICKWVFIPFVGYADFEQLTPNTFMKYCEGIQPTSSMKQLIHYLQLYNTGIFREFDYGKNENFRRYGREEPPEYDLSKITAPVAYFWGENDCWSRPNDIADITRKMPNLVLSYRIPHKYFNHLDSMAARDVKVLLYDKMTETIRQNYKETSRMEI